MKIRSLMLLSSVGAALISAGCTGYPLGVPLGLTEAEIAALPAAKQAAVRTAYARLPAKPELGRGASEFNASKEVVDASRSAAMPSIAKLEPIEGENRYRDTSPGAVR